MEVEIALNFKFSKISDQCFLFHVGSSFIIGKNGKFWVKAQNIFNINNRLCNFSIFLYIVQTVYNNRCVKIKFKSYRDNLVVVWHHDLVNFPESSKKKVVYLTLTTFLAINESRTPHDLM